MIEKIKLVEVTVNEPEKMILNGELIMDTTLNKLFEIAYALPDNDLCTALTFSNMLASKINELIDELAEKGLIK